jgi:hypothetical protein
MRELRLQKGKGSKSAESHGCHQLARPSCGGESPIVTRRPRLLMSSASVGIRSIGMLRSKSAGSGSLENELYAGNRRRETMSESEMQAELERFPVTLYKEQWLRILAGSPSSKPYSFLFRLGVVFADERLDLRRTRCESVVLPRQYRRPARRDHASRYRRPPSWEVERETPVPIREQARAISLQCRGDARGPF